MKSVYEMNCDLNYFDGNDVLWPATVADDDYDDDGDDDDEQTLIETRHRNDDYVDDVYCYGDFYWTLDRLASIGALDRRLTKPNSMVVCLQIVLALFDVAVDLSYSWYMQTSLSPKYLLLNGVIQDCDDCQTHSFHHLLLNMCYLICVDFVEKFL